MDATHARAILAEAKQRESYEAPIPEDDAKAISEAEALVEMAETAWEQHVRGPEVEAILRMAAASIEEAEEKLKEPGVFTQEEISQQVDEHVYEPDPDPEVDMTRTPPWDDYNEIRVPVIKESLAMYVSSTKDPWELLEHVRVFEEMNKNRSRILNYVAELQEELNDKAEDHLAVGTDSSQNPEEARTEEDRQESDDQEGNSPSSEAESNLGVSGLDSQKDYGRPVFDSSGQDEVPGPLDSGIRNTEENGHWGSRDARTSEDGSGTQDSQFIGDSNGREGVRTVHEGQGQNHSGDSEGSKDATDGRQLLPLEEELNYDDLIEQVEEELREKRLHVPPPPQDKAPEIPYDYSRITDAELHSLHAIFSMFAYRANYLLMRDERIAVVTKQAADEMARELLVAAEKYDHKGHEKRVALLEAEIEADPDVKKLRKIQRKHEIFATAHRQERDSYLKLVESMSRLETMRQNEWERSRR